MVSDLRQALWLFVHNLSEALSREEESDADIRTRLGRLEQLAQRAAAADLKREVLETLGGLSTLLDARRERQRRHVESMGQRLRALGNELESARREIDTDALTGLYNRKALDDYLARTLEVARLFGHEAVLLLIDIDSFKGINDTQGHAAGDEALRKIADATIRVCLRKPDFVARCGGDELAVVLRETALRQAQSLAERLLHSVRLLKPEGTQGPFPVTVSIGIAAVARDDSMRTGSTGRTAGCTRPRGRGAMGSGWARRSRARGARDGRAWRAGDARRARTRDGRARDPAGSGGTGPVVEEGFTFVGDGRLRAGGEGRLV